MSFDDDFAVRSRWRKQEVSLSQAHEHPRRATTVVATAAAAGTAVRCCRVHVCSYTRGPTYARSAAYRPRGTRTRTRTVVREVGESLKEGERRHGGNRRLETPDARRRGSDRSENQRANAWTPALVGKRKAPVGNDAPIAAERGSRAAPPGEERRVLWSRARTRLFTSRVPATIPLQPNHGQRERR